VTGTNGKTTTKELVASILGKKMKVHFTRSNLNNEIGVPLTILSAPPDTEFMVIEMGANHIGEIRTLCNIARPDFGIITNIGTAHIEGFGSWEGVVRAKTELYEYLRKVNGIAFYNDENNILKQKIFRLVNRAVPFSAPAGIPLSVQAVPSENYLRVVITYRNESHEVSTKLFGSYNLENIKAAVAISLFMGAGMNDIVDSLQNYNPANNRSQFKKTDRNTLICDSYNANPTSMSLALKDFSALKAGRKMVILGDMFELGPVSDEEHQKILDLVGSLNFDRVFLAGPVFCKMNKEKSFMCFKNTELLCEELKKNPVNGYHILIKGSRGMSLEKTYDLL
ncbi:MAG: UDP-N-acetylmuramoyl-tripeptide--D-alanyl-D-alanine ligase, partial [Bacteroidales bacterium]|nr:UDP-N-acetylmuramoyl-tripeptide--D-alanyl-D-alanine ligase [Bacteroidales bacterium]